MTEIDYIELENGLEYAIVDEIIIDNIKYLYLINEQNMNDINLRKLDKEENLIPVDDNQEHNKAMLEFMKKHRNDFTK